MTTDTSGFEIATLAVTTLSVELGAGLLDLFKLGEGASTGGWRGYARDALRAAGLGLMMWGATRAGEPSASAEKAGPEVAAEKPGEPGTEPVEAPKVGEPQPAEAAPGELTGPVKFKAPPGATPEQIEQVKAYCEGCNEAMLADRLSPTGRVSTAGELRRQASRAAQMERAAAEEAGTPYEGHVGHVPDTTWTGEPEPYSWMDLDPTVNRSLGGQASRYPVGFKPTGFEYEPPQVAPSASPASTPESTVNSPDVEPQ